MHGPGSIRDTAFERAFVAMRYFLGARGVDLADALGDPSPAVSELALELNHPDRQRRAERLATELGQVVRALDGRTYK